MHHDIDLPDWGPYSKRHIGVSHIADRLRGIRFDLTVVPGLYHRKIEVPNVGWESGWHPWRASSDLRYYCHRHQLEWKDRVFVDISVSAQGDRERMIRCRCVNRTDQMQNLSLHVIASLELPPVHPVLPQIPEDGLWIAALDYEDLRYATPRPQDHLGYDGLLRGEVRGSGFSHGSGIGQGFGETAGDTVMYRFTRKQPMNEACLICRFRPTGRGEALFQLHGAIEGELRLRGQDGEWALARLPVGSIRAGDHMLELVAQGGGCVEIDGFALLPAASEAELTFVPEPRENEAAVTAGPCERSLILAYPDLPQLYGLAWSFPSWKQREIRNRELDPFLRQTVLNHVDAVLKGDGLGHFNEIYLHPIVLKPGEERDVFGLVCQGNREEVASALTAFDGADDDCRAASDRNSRKGAMELNPNPDGEPYRFSQERMAATALSQVVFPIYLKQHYVKHYSPGRWWDSLYTWDSGFLALGLTALDTGRALDCLNAYLTEPGDSQHAFIHHGTPLPVQHYVFQELWNQTQQRDLLARLYPRLRQYHQFLLGHEGGGSTRTLKSGLLRTWDYFYNSGGWDDYPPQWHLRTERPDRYPVTTPCVNSAHAIRTAKILRGAAGLLGIEEDIAGYDQDIASLADALQRHAWDEESGYFGYVLHDADGEPSGLLQYRDGTNFNMGLDGVSPLVAGICTTAQIDRLCANLADPAKLWTPIGLTTVDQSAPYYNPAGYWNGAVWFPHQWFIWKALLDVGRGDLAWQIARTALDLWKREVEESYHCFEHFIVSSGRGAGWHQFTGLSLPVLLWFGAYYRPGHLTLGHDGWIEQLEWLPDHTGVTAQLAFTGDAAIRSTVAVMAPGHRYRVSWNGKPLAPAERADGTLELQLTGASRGKLEISVDTLNRTNGIQ